MPSYTIDRASAHVRLSTYLNEFKRVFPFPSLIASSVDADFFQEIEPLVLRSLVSRPIGTDVSTIHASVAERIIANRISLHVDETMKRVAERTSIYLPQE